MFLKIIPKDTPLATSNDLISNVNDLKTGFTDLNTLALTGVDLTTIFANASEASKKNKFRITKKHKIFSTTSHSYQCSDNRI